MPNLFQFYNDENTYTLQCQSMPFAILIDRSIVIPSTSRAKKSASMKPQPCEIWSSCHVRRTSGMAPDLSPTGAVRASKDSCCSIAYYTTNIAIGAFHRQHSSPNSPLWTAMQFPTPTAAAASHLPRILFTWQIGGIG